MMILTHFYVYMVYFTWNRCLPYGELVMKITKELLLSIILKYFNEKKEMSFYELEKKTGKSVVTPLNAKESTCANQKL